MGLSNREIAICFWFIVLLIYLIRSPEVRKSSLQLLKSFFVWKLQAVIGFSFIYTVAWVFILNKLSVWSWENLKTTILWFGTFAIYEAFNAHKVKNSSAHFKSIFKEVVSIALLISAISEFSTLSLWAELIVVPVFSILAMVAAVAENQPTGKKIAQFLRKFFIFLGSVWLLWNIGKICVSPNQFFSVGTLREIAVPVLLSVLYMPFIFLMRLFSKYETVFTRIDFALKDKGLRSKSKKLVFLSFLNDFDFLDRWLRYFNLKSPEDYKEVKQTVEDIKAVKRREKNPQLISKDLGWAPLEAENFLAEIDLKTSDYHWCYDEDWSAASNYLKLEDDITSNNLAFYLGGSELVVRELTLVLNINNPKMRIAAEERFRAASRILVEKALGKLDQILLDGISSLKPFSKYFGGATVDLTKQHYEGGIINGYTLSLVIRRDATKGKSVD